MATAVNFTNIPAELKASVKFCVWKKEKGKGNARLTKIPYNPVTRERAQTNNENSFGSFASAMKTYAMGGYDGIGIRVSEGIGAIDIDHCIREDGSLNDVAASILGIFKDAYFERSPSGTGLRGFFQLDDSFLYDKTVYYINNRSLGLEIYLPGTTNRFVTVTGDQFRAGIVPMDMAALQNVLDTFMKRKTRVVNTTIEACSYLSDEEVIAHATRAKDGDVFQNYYEGNWQEYFDNQSDADMSFVSKLAFWCGCVEEQMDRIFRASGMMRPKWDEYRGESTYGAITLRNAVATCKDIYIPPEIREARDASKDFEKLDDDEDYQADLSQIKTTLEQMAPHTNPRYGQGEIGIGNMFADYFKDVARYNSDRGVWFVYDGTIWREDKKKIKVAELAKLLANRLLSLAADIPEENTRMRFLDRIKKLQQRKHRDTMIKDAMSVHPVPHALFDRDMYLFNMKNGTLNLRTGEFYDHNPEDFLTKFSAVSFDPEAECLRFIQFMDEIMMGDKESIRYLQKALGYSLSSDTRMECFFILYGATSRNGKGTLMETFLNIMGNYGKNTDPLMLGTKYKQNSGGPSEDLARLSGARFVNISEPDKKLVVDAALTKRLTGNDTITARFLNENSFEFKPTFKIFVNTNHKPNITDDTLFTSGRVKLIPFNRHFEEQEQDKGLKLLFKEPENMSGIFNWLLEGFRLYMKEGLDIPKSVREATDAYQLESDRIGQFVKQCLKHAPGEELRSQAVYNRYKDWCRDENNFRAESQPSFKKGLEKYYTVQRRKPWKEKASESTFVNDVTWAMGEEPEADLAPEFEPVKD